MQRNSLTRTCLLLWAAALTSVLVTCMSPSAVGVAHRQILADIPVLSPTALSPRQNRAALYTHASATEAGDTEMHVLLCHHAPSTLSSSSHSLALGAGSA